MTAVKQHCWVCQKMYTTTYRGWYDRNIPWVCSSQCFVRWVKEAHCGLPDLTKEDPRVQRYFSPVSTGMRSGYEREFRQWLLKHKDVLGYEYEHYSFTLADKSRYVPDFLLDGRLFVEVKGLWNSEGKKKFLALIKEFELPIVVVDKEFLNLLKRTGKANDKSR